MVIKIDVPVSTHSVVNVHEYEGGQLNIMHQSIQNFNIPPGQSPSPPGILYFEFSVGTNSHLLDQNMFEMTHLKVIYWQSNSPTLGTYTTKIIIEKGNGTLHCNAGSYFARSPDLIMA